MNFTVTALLMLLLTSNPLMADTGITVNIQPDGKGSIVLSDTSKREADDTAQATVEQEDIAEMKEAASEYGEGVTFASLKPINTPKSSGIEVIYNFADINKVKFDTGTGDEVEINPEPGVMRSGMIAFEYTPGSPARLKVNFTAAPLAVFLSDDDTEKTPEDEIESAMELVREALEDSGVTVNVKVAGEIAETHAKHHEGGTITLLSIDTNALINDKATVKKLVVSPPKTQEELLKIIGALPGIKIEPAKEVTAVIK